MPATLQAAVRDAEQLLISLGSSPTQSENEIALIVDGATRGLLPTYADELSAKLLEFIAGSTSRLVASTTDLGEDS